MKSHYHAILAWHGQGWWTLDTTPLGGMWLMTAVLQWVRTNRTEHGMRKKYNNHCLKKNEKCPCIIVALCCHPIFLPNFL